MTAWDPNPKCLQCEKRFEPTHLDPKKTLICPSCRNNNEEVAKRYDQKPKEEEPALV